jgi:pyrroloquinoline quinone biosynthesis protein D
VLQANGTAVEVLKLCDGERSFAQIVDDLAQRFAIDRARIAGEAEALLRDLAAKRIVEL